MDALDALVRPVGVLVGGADEQDVAARGVGAVALDDRGGRDDVALGLAHLGAVLGDHPLGEQRPEGLLEVELSQVGQRLGEEARVHQVQDRVLDPADVLVDGHPLAQRGRVPRGLVRCARRSSAGSTTRSPRTCPSCRSPAVPARRRRGTRWPPSPRRPPAVSARAERSPRCRAARPAAARRGRAAFRSRSQWTIGIGQPQ